MGLNQIKTENLLVRMMFYWSWAGGMVFISTANNLQLEKSHKKIKTRYTYINLINVTL